MRILTIMKVNGQIATSDADILQGIHALLRPRGNGEYRLSLEKNVKQRTVDQNRLLWLWLTCISQETGNTPQELHDVYCAKFLRKTVHYCDRDVTVVSGTSGLNTAQFTEFLDRIQAHAAAELGIELPNPADQIWEAFAAYYSNR